jgi:hypothetical protein
MDGKKPAPSISPTMTFRDKLEQRISATGSNLCVGLDIRADQADEVTEKLILKLTSPTPPTSRHSAGAA